MARKRCKYNVLARRPFSAKVVILVDPLAKLGSLLTQTGAQCAPWPGRQSTKLSAKIVRGAGP